MSGPFDFKGQAIKDSYHRLVQIVSGNLHDGTGSLIIPPSASYAITASYAVSASHEIVKEVSSSYAETASYANNFVVQNNLTASNVSASFYYGDGSNLTGIEPFPYTGSAKITGSLVLTGSIYAETSPGSQKLVIKSSNASVNNNAHIGIGNTTNPASRNIAIGYINSPKYDSVQIGGRNVGGGIAGITIGDNAASNNSRTGTIAIGQNSNRFSNGDIAIGNSSLYNDGPLGSIGTIAIGLGAGNAQSGTQNVILGTSAARTSVGSNSIFIGYETGRNNIGDNNVILGHSAGYNVTGSNNVLLGYQAGYNLTGSNQLIIANTGSHALVTGDFANNTFNILGSVSASTYYGDGSNLTGIEQTDISALNTFTGSIQTSVNTLTAATSSYNTSTANITLDTSTLIMTDVSAEITSAESQSIDTTPTSSNAIFYNYVLENYQASGSNRSSRAGNLILINDGTNVNLSDYTVTALGDGDDPYFSASIEDTDTNLYLKDGQSYHFKAVKQHFVAPTSSVELPDTDSAAPLLDSVTGAVVACSVRKINSLYTGPCMRVREEGSNTEIDIEFDANGNLDTSAIASHCGSNAGRVTIWYDQSGNGNDLIQDNASDQPHIYNNGSVTTGYNITKPAVAVISNVNTQHLTTSASLNLSNPHSIMAVSHGGSNSSTIYNSLNNSYFTRVTTQKYLGSPHNLTRSTEGIPNLTKSSVHLLAQGTVGSYESRLKWNNDEFTHSNTTPSKTITKFRIFDSPVITQYQANINEIIVWPSDVWQYRETINRNATDYYNLYDYGLLIDYPGATAAYSVRQLTTAATNCMDIRRASDNTEQTIGFTSAGNLDTGSIETFCTGSECYVATWYDQSGNGNDATQTSQNNQPLIYRSGSVFTKNNITAIDFSRGTPNEPHYNDNKKKNMQFTLSSTIAQPTTYTMVHDYKDGPGYSKIFGGTNQQMLKALIIAGAYLNTPSPSNTYQVNSIIFSGSNSIRRVNNSQVTSGNAGSDSISGNVLIGGDTNSANYWDSGSFQEFVFWPSNQSASGDISAIETNINDYFDIY